MGISRVEVERLMVFQNELAIDFCGSSYGGINVLIGDNGSGKTTLLWSMYGYLNDTSQPPSGVSSKDMAEHYSTVGLKKMAYDQTENSNIAYIPEKDILEHAKGLLPFIEQKQTGFSHIYRNVLIAAQDVPTKEQTEMQKSIAQQIIDITDGTVEWNQAYGSFHMAKTDGTRILFAHEASAYKKLGFLGLLVSSGQIKPGTILFWDEPENSLNLELIPKLVDILQELAKNEVQIFIATHSYDIVRYLDIRKNKDIPVLFHYLSKQKPGQITCSSSSKYTKLPDNHLERAGEDLFEAVIADSMGV